MRRPPASDGELGGVLGRDRAHRQAVAADNLGFKVARTVAGDFSLPFWRRAEAGEREEAFYCLALWEGDFVGPGRAPVGGDGVEKAIDQALREGVESDRHEPVGELWRAPLADARREIVGCICFERNRQHAVRRSAKARLNQIAGALGQKLGLTGAGACDHTRRAGVAQGIPRRRFEIVNAARAPVLWPNKGMVRHPLEAAG